MEGFDLVFADVFDLSSIQGFENACREMTEDLSRELIYADVEPPFPRCHSLPAYSSQPDLIYLVLFYFIISKV